MRKGVITKGSDVPVGATDLYNKLINLGAEKSWFKVVSNKGPKISTASHRKRYYSETSDADDDDSSSPYPSVYRSAPPKLQKYTSRDPNLKHLPN